MAAKRKRTKKPTLTVAQLRAMPYQRYLRTPHWRKVRAAARKRANYRCEYCDRKPPRLEVHHLTYKNLGREKPEDLKVLCIPCHRAVHGVPFTLG